MLGAKKTALELMYLYEIFCHLSYDLLLYSFSTIVHIDPMTMF